MFLGIDLGTTSMKALVVNEKGEVVKSFQTPLNILIPQALWREQNPKEWEEGLFFLLHEVAKEYKIEAIGLSGQMHSLVALDERDIPLRNSLLWCDQRTSVQCRQATHMLGGEKSVIAQIGNPILEGFTLPKILWIQSHEPEIFKKIRSILLPKDYLAFLLTAQKGTDPSDASGTAFYNVFENRWQVEWFTLLGLDPRILPPIFPSASVRGMMKKELADSLRWEHVQVITGGADNAVAALGIGMALPGEGMVSVGTSGTVVVATEKKKPDLEGKIHFFNHVLPDVSYYMGVMLAATHSLDWFREKFGKQYTWKQLEESIEATYPGSNGLIFLPYLNGERTPHRNPDAKGVLFGISSSNTTGDVYRSILEGVTYGLRDSFELIRAKTKIEKMVIVGGGSNNRAWCKMIATNFGIPLEIPLIDQGTAYGAAMLSALGSGYSLDTVRGWVKTKEIIEPIPHWQAKYARGYELYQKLYQHLQPFFKEATGV